MITEGELLSILEKENLHAFKINVDLETKDIVLLQSESIDELIRFSKLNNINSIFYNYMNYDEKEYKLDLEEIELYLEEDIFKLIKKDIIKHNKEIDKIDFSKPCIVHIYVIYQGQKIGIIILDDWLESREDEILEAEDQLECFIKKYEDIIHEKLKKEQEKLSDLKIEFEKFLLNDEEFLCCTNQVMRKHYMKSVFDKADASQYKKVFMKKNRFGDTLLDNTELLIFIDSVWRKYKFNNKK